MPPKNAIPAPPATPPRLSLLSAANVISDGARWDAGFSYEPEACDSAGGAVNPCTTHSKTITSGTGAIDVEVFTVWAGDACSPWGYASRDYQNRARRKLLACQSREIESELWTGTLARAADPDWANKYLANNDSDVLSAGPMSTTDALACLEQALAECNCGSQGMIHAMPQIVTQWIANNLVRREGNQLLTFLDTIVVPGSGYDGSGPNAAEGGAPIAAADGSIWAYATGMVHIRLGDMKVVPDSLDQALARDDNLVEYRAERDVAYYWDCCHAAVEINEDLCGIAGAGS